MLNYIIKRLIITIPVIIGVAILIFSIMYLVPSDPARVLLGLNTTSEALNELREKLGLNDNYFIRLGRFLRDTFLYFDLGTSLFTRTTVVSEISARFPRTAILAFSSVLAGACIGVPLGVSAAVHQNRLADKICMFFSVIFFCVPQFWIALMLVILFSVRLNWLPAYGIGGIQYYIIPCLAITLHGAAMVARQMRSSMLEVIRSDFVTTVRSQGFTERSIINRTVLPNALIPIVTVIGGGFAHAIGGTIIIETIFSIPGIGLYLNTGINQRDYPIIQGSVVVVAIMFCLIMLLVDIAYAVIDPRIREQFAGGKRGRRRLQK